MRAPAFKRHPHYFGEYITPDGYRVYRSCDDNRWVMRDPETGNIMDSSERLSYLRELYG